MTKKNCSNCGVDGGADGGYNNHNSNEKSLQKGKNEMKYMK